jgi:hypothetical protein
MSLMIRFISSGEKGAPAIIPSQTYHLPYYSARKPGHAGGFVSGSRPFWGHRIRQSCHRHEVYLLPHFFLKVIARAKRKHSSVLTSSAMRIPPYGKHLGYVVNHQNSFRFTEGSNT